MTYNEDCRVLPDELMLTDEEINHIMRRGFTRRLKEARKAAGLRQRDVTNELGCSLNKYASYEQGASEPSIPTLIRLCHMFGTTPNALLGLTP